MDGKELTASNFAYVGDANDPATWHLPIPDAAHLKDALARFNQTDLPDAAKKRVAKRLLAAAKKFGIDASGFASEHGLKTSEAEDYSFEELQDALQQALQEKFGRDEHGYRRYCLCETFPDYLIAQGPDGELYQIAYSVGADEEDITLGDPQEVETAYVPVAEAARFLAKESAAPEFTDGWTWPVEVMKAGEAFGSVEDANGKMLQLGHYFPSEFVGEVAKAVEGARFGRRHPLSEEEVNDPERTAGWFTGSAMAGDAARAKLNLLKNETNLREKLLAARESGKLDLFGLSFLGYISFKPGKIAGKDYFVAQRLAKLVSVDMCNSAGAGGSFLNPLRVAASKQIFAEIAAMQRAQRKTRAPAAAATQASPGASLGRNSGSPQAASHQRSGPMKDHILKVLEALRTINAGRAAELQKEFENTAEEKHSEFFAKVSEAVTQEMPAALITNAANAKAAMEGLTNAAKTALDNQNLEVLAKTKEALDNARKVNFTSTLDRKLTESKLPVPAASLVRERFADQVAEDKDVDAYIMKTRQAFAAFSNVGTIGTGGTIEVGRNSLDKIQLASDAMLGVKEALKDRNVKPFRGLREMYRYCTGDEEVHLDGRGFYRVSEAIASSDFPQILLSSLTKKLLQDYAEFQIVPGLEKLYTTSILGDYKPQDRVRMGYLGDLPTVTEAAAYVELTKPTDEKITYSILKKGGLLTISEETIRNDDLGKIAQFPNRLARAARHTLATFVTAFFITPPAYDPDTIAWMHASHANLGSTALSAAELDARAILLAKQSEKDSTNRLGLTLDWIMIPVDLKPTAQMINRNMTGTNSWVDKFGENEENIIVNPLLTDVNDWYGGTLPNNAPFLEIGFLDGYQTPQLFIANLPTQGTQFTNDQLQYKAKFVFGGKPIDYRGVFKEVVA
jgi:hypothetical protein